MYTLNRFYIAARHGRPCTAGIKPDAALLPEKPTQPRCSYPTIYQLRECFLRPLRARPHKPLDDVYESWMAVINDTKVEEGSLHALASAFTMIIFSEIGDKTFLIAAILAMRHPRLTVFAGSFGSLAVMSLLSAQLGHLVPTLLPQSVTELAAAVLFFVFGAKMLKEAADMKAGNEKIQEEMKEAEEEIEGDDAKIEGGPGASIPLEEIEEGGRANGHARGHSRSNSASTTASSGILEGLRNFFSFFLGPVFVQAFVLTFLGEWGDRSQISTIALGAAHVSGLLLMFELRPMIPTERLPSCDWDHCRPRMLHSAGCAWRALHIYQNIYQTRQVHLYSVWTFTHSAIVTMAGAILFLVFGIVYMYEFFAGHSTVSE